MGLGFTREFLKVLFGFHKIREMEKLRDWFKKDESEIGNNSPTNGSEGTSKKGINPLWVFLTLVGLIAAAIIISRFC